MTQANPLHTVIGEVSAVTYFVCSLLALLTFAVYAIFPLQIVATLHMVLVLVALFTVCGLVIWWIVEYVILGDSDGD